MLIAQITDIHLGFEPGHADEPNAQRLAAVLAALAEMAPRPDLLLATGDLTEHGDAESYARLREALKAAPCPTLLCLGNHDVRASFCAQFPDLPVMATGHVQYVHRAGPLRLIVLDTLEEGRHGGAFCEARAAWLSARLAEAPDLPTLLVLHHPPVETGIPWMTIGGEEPWIARLRAAIAGHGQIVGMVCGHIHRALTTGWAGTPLAVCSSTAPQVALELSEMDPDRPDGRPMIVADAPAYALHYWNGAALVTHFATAEAHAPLASYDAKLQPLVRQLLAERRGD